jgi:hypothetical protein
MNIQRLNYTIKVRRVFSLRKLAMIRLRDENPPDMSGHATDYTGSA